MNSNNTGVFCCFCAKPNEDVVTMVVSSLGYAICNECVDRCQHIMAKRRANPPPIIDGTAVDITAQEALHG